MLKIVLTKLSFICDEGPVFAGATYIDWLIFGAMLPTVLSSMLINNRVAFYFSIAAINVLLLLDIGQKRVISNYFGSW
jgi:hypothetical protein